MDDYLHMYQSRATESMNMFCAAVGKVFGPIYQSAPNATRIRYLGAVTACIGDGEIVHNIHKVSITKNMLERVVLYSNQWQIMTCGFGTFFGMGAAYNRINMLQCSQMLARLVER